MEQNDLHLEANKIREKMAKGAVDRLIQELSAIPDDQLMNAMDRHIKIKIKLI